MADVGNETDAPFSKGEGHADAIERVEVALTRLARVGDHSLRHDGNPADRAVLDRGAYTLLERVEDAGPIRLTDLACRLGVDISTASRQVRSLEARGLLTRSGDPQDQRARYLAVTETGRSALARTREDRHARIDERLASWSEPDRQELARLLGHLVASLSAPVPLPSDDPQMTGAAK